MQVETALFFESLEQIYVRVFRSVRPRMSIPQISVRFREYANANSRIRLEGGRLTVDISDVLQGAPAPIHEALAFILICKLYRKAPENGVLARYRRYLNRADIRRTLHQVKQQRGRKAFRDPKGSVFDLREIFDDLNLKYFNGQIVQPQLGWSMRPSRTTLGHYDPSHNVIVLTSLLDSDSVPELIVRFVMFHEMLHLCHPTQHKGSRRCVHTREFKMAERRFEGYDEAKHALKAFAEQNR